MKPLSLLFIFFVSLSAYSQKIIPITHNGQSYEVLDMTGMGKVMWGGYEEIPADAAKSESNGALNTKAIVLAIGDNKGYEGKPYAARICANSKAGDKEDWYLPSKEESEVIYAFKEKFNVEERGTIWTSTEANGTQAVSKYWYTGAYYNVQKVDEYHFVCIRKVEK